MKTVQRGFTLIEIAIVLVIIGLLLGGVLKGQELITSARVRNLIQQQDGVKAAYFGFLDRFRALPGDYGAASKNIQGGGTTPTDGNGDGQIVEKNATNVLEAVLVWEHLSKAGFINGSYIYSSSGPTEGSNAKNPYGAYLQLVYDGFYGANTGATGTATSPARHHLKTGASIPSDILAEIDRKVDDGAPHAGAFQYSGLNATAGCVSATPFTWVPGQPNCGGASLY